MTVLDQGRDANGQHLYGMLITVGPDGVKLFSEPDFVKAAGSEAILGGPDPSPGSYANPKDRTFPCHTAPATWVSALYFHSQRDAMPEKVAAAVEKRIDAAAGFLAISGAVEQVKRAAAAARAGTTDGLPDESYAVVVVQEGGRRERFLPLRHAADVKAACEHLRLHGRDYTFNDRRTIAEKVLTKAASFSVALGDDEDFLAKNAGHGTCHVDTAARLVFSRAEAVRRAGRDLDLAEGLAKMAQTLLKDPGRACTPSNLWKLASIVDQVDAKYGLSGLSGLDRPEDVLFQVTVKKAAAVLQDHVSMTTGNIYSRRDLGHLRLEDVRGAMGDGFAAAVSSDGLYLDAEKLAEVAPTLPRQDAETFDDLMGRLLVEPVHKEAAHSGSGPLARPGALAELAGLHRPA